MSWKSKVKKIFFFILRYSGIPYLIRETIQRRKVTILMFHDISLDTAKKCFTFLDRNYNVISLDEFIQANISNDSNILPEKSLIITFDDGHKQNYEMLPVIKEIGIPISIFLCAGIIDTNRCYWFKYHGLKRGSDYYKKFSNEERLKLLNGLGFYETKEFDTPMALTKNQIEEMSSFVNFQCHTMFHPCLSQCSDVEIENELKESKELLEKDYLFDINSIAYPNGDYSNLVIDIVRNLNFQCALTIEHGYNSIDSDLYRLKRISTNDVDDMNEFIVRSSGVWGYIKSSISSIKKA